MTEDKREVIYEEETRKRLGLAFESCCTSCHENVDMFGFDWCEVNMPDGSIAMVCCCTQRQLDAAIVKLTKEPEKP